MKKRFLHLAFILIIAAIFSTSPSTAQAPSIDWETSLGGSYDEKPWDVLQTTDGGYIVSGFTKSNDYDIHGFKGYQDAWLTKLNSTGDTLWTKCFGGSNGERAASVEETYDGGLVFGGHSDSQNGDVSMGTNSQSLDFWLVKTDSLGNVLWSNTYGGSGLDNAHSVCLAKDSGIVMGGFTQSSSGDVSGFNGGSDYWVVKTDRYGKLQWQSSLGGSGNDRIRNIISTQDNGFLAIGFSNSSGGDVSGNHGDFDYWIVKLDSNGNIEWENNYGGSSEDKAYHAYETASNGFRVAGYSESADGDVLVNKGNSDFWIIEIDSTGNLIRQKSLGGNKNDKAFSIVPSIDGHTIVAGETESTGGDVINNHGDHDIWVVKLFERDSDFGIGWQKSLGGTMDDERPFSTIVSNDSGYVLAGRSKSYNGSLNNNNGMFDFWTVKLKDPNVGIEEQYNHQIGIYPNPTSGDINIDFQNFNSNSGLSVEVYDTYGNMVKSKAIGDPISQIDLSQNSSGVYFILISGDEGNIYSKKVILTKN